MASDPVDLEAEPGAPELSGDFDPKAFVDAYRKTIAKMETDPDNSELRKTVRRLRESWKRWQGEDSLHEMAFGEP